jgi:hypothetical protein
MRPNGEVTRRSSLKWLGLGAAALASGALNSNCCAATAAPGNDLFDADQTIIAGVRAAVEKTLNPALRQRAYPGHFTVVADGTVYGTEDTYPGLDSWEMAGAYLALGKQREVLDYFDFVQASQRRDGNIPMTIFPADRPPESMGTYLRGLRYPEDVYIYKPVVRPDQPKYSNMSARKWIGLFTHWQTKANPLGVLGPICFILTAQEIFAATKSHSWLREKSPALEATGRYLLTRISPNGLMGGAGFYVETPPRNQWDGVTQCYAVWAFRQLASLNGSLGKPDAASTWNRYADTLRGRFLEVFWRGDHFAEYVHPEHGLVDAHGLSDVNWAAVGLGVATEDQDKRLWPILAQQPMFWCGGMPTQLVTKPASYETWEYPEPLPFKLPNPLYDVAAMGRIWYLETLACLRMQEYKRLRESVLKVCQMGKKQDWLWSERYRAERGDTVKPEGPHGYCEYAAILVRTVLGNPSIFPENQHLGSIRQAET